MAYKLVYWILFLNLLILYSDCVTPPCLPGWQQSGSSCLLINNGYQVTRDQASKDCNSHDATLLRFETGDDVKSFVQTVKQYGVDGWWTDLTEVNHPGIWTWGDNEEVFNDALIWNQEPDDTRHVENCVSMSYEGKISDEMCWQKLGYICSYALPSNGNCADGWLNSATKCYYISATDDPFNVLTWMDALGKCMTMVTGQTPTLVSFNSKEEYQLISQYLAIAQVKDMNWWIGLNDQNKEGNYVWTNGPADLSVVVWDKAPSKLALTEKCGVVHGNGKMSYGKCNKDLNYYICKLKLNNDNLMIYEELGCTGLWTRAGHKCYYFVPGKKVVRADARTQCQKLGGDLPKIESLDEMYWVTLQTFTMEVNHVWTGLARKSKGADSWSWADGSDINIEYIKWNQEPNDYLGKEDCAAISMDGVYNDMSCSDKAGYICQMTSVNRPCPSSWIMPDSEGSSCFYISGTDDNVTTTWDAAKDKCNQLAGGGDSSLFAPQSGEDYAFVTQQLMSRPPDPTGWWTDLTDSQVEGLWAYSTSYYGPPDRSLIVWRGEPNDFGGTEDCAVMYYGGRYNDVDCSAKSNILCEKPSTPFPTTSNGNTLTTFQHVSLITTMFVVLIQQELLPLYILSR